MLDKHTYRDHRREAAMATDQGSSRGWNFDQAVDDGPLWLRALAECLRPRSLFLFAVIGAVASVWFL